MKADQRAFLEDWGVISKEPSTTVKPRPFALDVSKDPVLDWKVDKTADTEYSR